MRGGPGETQIELDRRMINDSIKRTKERLDKVKKQRSTQRRQRNRRDRPSGHARRCHKPVDLAPDQAATAIRRRRSAVPTAPKPRIISAQVPGSGTATAALMKS